MTTSLAASTDAGFPTAPALTVGGDGMIGGLLAAALTADGEASFVTTRRRDSVGGRRLFVDLDAAAWDDALRTPFAVAYLCAAMARLDACLADPVRAVRVNADHMTALAAALAARGCYVILLSTNQVFDGARPAPGCGDAPCPTSVYGRSKAAAERGVLGLAADPAVPPPGVLRLSKVVEPGMPLLAGWAERLRRGERVRAARDMTLAPLPAAQVIEALRAMAARRTPGIVQLAAGGEISYVDAARHVARRVGASPDLVDAVDSLAAGFLKEAPPPHTLLDGSRAADELGVRPVDPFAALDYALGSPSSTGL
jgi:dTDP-4-dehydrorhamnose reductase